MSRWQQELQYLHAQLTASMNRVDQNLAQLGHHLNSTALVNRLLPLEIISAILLFLVEDHIHPWLRAPLSNTDPLYGWLRYTQICRHWRFIALNTPLIWTFLFSTSSLNLLQLMIDRSRGALFVATVTLNKNPDQCDLIFAQIGRCKILRVLQPAGLHFEVTPPMLSRIVDSLLPSAAHLRNLTIQVWPQGHAETGEETHEQSEAPGKNSEGTVSSRGDFLPALKLLSLHQSSFSALGHICRPTLTHLSVTSIAATDHPSAILRVLRNLPLLQCLDLRGALDDPGEALHKLPEARLDFLRAFTIQSNGPNAAWIQLLGHLSFSPRTRLSYTMAADGQNTSWSEVSFLQSLFARGLPAIEQLPEAFWPFPALFLSCEVLEDDRPPLCIVDLGCANDIFRQSTWDGVGFPDCHVGRHLRLLLTLPNHQEVLPQWFNHPTSGLAALATGIRKLVVKFPMSEIDIFRWATTTYQRFPHVEVLCSWGQPAMATLLNPPVCLDPDSLLPVNPPFPKLKTLVYVTHSISPDPASNPGVWNLNRALRSRVEAGYPRLERLVLVTFIRLVEGGTQFDVMNGTLLDDFKQVASEVEFLKVLRASGPNLPQAMYSDFIRIAQRY
jgi:hypothetical protein